MSDVIAVEEESDMSRFLRTVRQDVAFFFKSVKLKFARRLVFRASRLQTKGAAGQDVVQFQERFNHFAARYDIYIAAPVNGIYDEDTRAAVASFQRVAMYILEADGFVGPETARVLHIKLLEG